MPYQINPSERFSGECLICGTTYNLLTISRTPAGLAVQCWGALISLKHSEPILFSPPHKDQGWALKNTSIPSPLLVNSIISQGICPHFQFTSDYLGVYLHTSTNTLAAEPYSRYGTPVTV